MGLHPCREVELSLIRLLELKNKYKNPMNKLIELIKFINTHQH